MSTLFKHNPHPHIEDRREEGPVTTQKVVDQSTGESKFAKFNAWLAIKITSIVGTMWCAYSFAVLAFLSLPAVLSGFSAFHGTFPNWLVKASVIALVAWIAQTFLQLVLLSIIIVGQNIQAAGADARSEATYKDADAVLHEALEIQRHLEAQDAVLTALSKSK